MHCKLKLRRVGWLFDDPTASGKAHDRRAVVFPSLPPGLQQLAAGLAG